MMPLSDKTAPPPPVSDLSALADELGAIRAQIATLKSRAVELRLQVVAARVNGPVQGAAYGLTVKRQTRRSFLRDRLPADILANPDYWRETHTDIVQTKRLAGGQGVSARPDAEEEFDVFERF